MMSAACQHYQENAWKGGVCCNCFLPQAEHERHRPQRPMPKKRPSQSPPELPSPINTEATPTANGVCTTQSKPNGKQASLLPQCDNEGQLQTESAKSKTETSITSQPRPPPRSNKKLSVDIDAAQKNGGSVATPTSSPCGREKPETPKRPKPVLPQKPSGVKPGIPSGKPSPPTTGKPSPPQKPSRKGSIGPGDNASIKPIPVKRGTVDGFRSVKSGPELTNLNTEQSEIDDVLNSLDQAVKDGEEDDNEVFSNKSGTRKHSNSDPVKSSTKADDKKVYSLDGEYSLPCDVAKTDSSGGSAQYKLPSDSTENSLDQGGDSSPKVKKIIKVNGAKTKESLSPAKILQNMAAKSSMSYGGKSEVEIRHQKVPIKPFKVGQESKAHIARPYKVIEVAPPQEVLPYTVVDISNMPIDNGVERELSLSPPPPKTPPPGEYDKPITSNFATGEKSPRLSQSEDSQKVFTTFKPTSPTPEKIIDENTAPSSSTASPAKIPLKPPPRLKKKPKSPYEPVGLDLPVTDEKQSTESSKLSTGDAVENESESAQKLKEEKPNSVKFAMSADSINADEQINGLTNVSIVKDEKSKAEFEKKVAQRRSFGRSSAFEAKLSAAIENTLDLAIRKKSKSRKPIPKMMTGENGADVTWDDDGPIEEVEEEDVDYSDLHQNPKELALLKEKFGKEEKQSKSYFKIGYKKLIPKFGRKPSNETKLREQEESTEDVTDISPDKDSVSVESVDEKEKDSHYAVKLFGRKKSKDKIDNNENKSKKGKDGGQEEDASHKVSKESLISAESRESISEEGSKVKDKKVKDKDKDKDKPSLFTRLENIRKSGRKDKKQQQREKLKRSMVHYAEGKEIHRDPNKNGNQTDETESSELVPPGSPEETYNKPWDSAQTKDRLAKVLNRPKSLPPTEHFHLKFFNLDKGKDKKEKNMPPSKEMLFRASSDEVVSAKGSLQQRCGTLTEEAMTEEGENIYDTVGNGFDFGKRAHSLQILPPPLPALPPPEDLSPDHPDKGIYEPVTPTGLEDDYSDGDGDDEEDGFEPIYDSVGLKTHVEVKDFSHTSSDSSHTTSSSGTELKPPPLPQANIEDYLEPAKLWDNPNEVPLPFRNVPEEAEESDSYDLVDQHKSGASSDADDLSLGGSSSTGLVCMASRYGHKPEPLPRPRSSRSLPGGASPKLSRGPSIKKPKPLDPYVTMIKEGRNKPLKEQPFTSFVDAFCHQATLTLNTLTKIHKLYNENWFLPEDKIPADLRFQDLDIKGDGPICQIDGYSFYCVRLRDMRCRTEYVLLVTDDPVTDSTSTLEHPNIFNLDPLMTDKIDVSSLPYTVQKYHTSSGQVHLRLLKFSFIETLNQYLTRMRSSLDLVDFEKQMCFVLLQIIDGLGVLQDNRGHFEQKLNKIVVISPLSLQDRTVALMPKIQEDGSGESDTVFEKSDVKDLLVSVLNLAFPGSDWDSVILFTPKYSRGVEKLFDILKTDPGSFLLHSKYLLEFLLFGPSGEDMKVILQMGGKESVYSDDTFQLWFETERVKVVNHLAQQTVMVAQEQNIRGLSHEYACKICFLCGDAGAQYMTVASMIYG